MSKPGKFIYKTFKGKVVELYLNIESEWIEFGETSVYNRFNIVGIVHDYDDDTEILTLINNAGHEFYISSDSIQLFWLHEIGFDLTDNITKMINSGTPIGIKQFHAEQTAEDKLQKHIFELTKSRFQE